MAVEFAAVIAHASLRLVQGGQGMVPKPGGECKHWREVHHQGLRDGHDIGLLAVMGGDQHHRAGLQQGEGLVEGEFFHERLRHRWLEMLRVAPSI